MDELEQDYPNCPAEGFFYSGIIERIQKFLSTDEIQFYHGLKSDIKNVY